MNLANLLRIALRALANNKLRGFLTMLGIIIGVASVITMLAIGQGSKKSIQAQISEMGSNMIMIHPGGDMRGGVRQSAEDMQTLKLEDYEDIVNETRFVSAVSPSVNSSGQVIYGANNAPTTIYGISPDYMEIRRYKIEDGDMFTEQDIQTAAKVCVIGKTIVDNLFPNGENPVGKVIRFDKLPFRIVGVLDGPGRLNLSSIHNYSKKGPGHHPFARHQLFGARRAVYRPGHRGDQRDTPPQPQVERK